ncbi:AAEL005557-PA [Aedes aegypti]|uniref:AAEL005557-PA n=1 Tax=Aedes aegypti TaxID=7159 RepID=Q179K7_AEDAE|nr:AAEL005557-PA [Aedes aegypti]
MEYNYHVELFTHTEPRFKCTRCPKTFFMRRTLLQHSQSHDEEYERERQRVSMADPKNIKECEICQIPFSNRQRLRHHMLTVHEEPKHKCAKCGKAFHYKGELNRHELVHAKNESGYLPPQEKKPKTVVEPASIPTCEQCNIQFLNKRIRHHHMVTVHSEPKFKCPYCPKVCYFLNTLERHQKTHSKIGAEKMCKTCGLQFETAAKKWRHMLNVHQIPRYRCPECADPFMYKRRLRRHMKHRHKKEIPVMSHGPYSMLSKNCSKCNLEFADMDEKRKHMQENHAELLVWCSQCPKAFGHKGSLQRHEQRVHGALPVRQVNAILEANALLQPNTVSDGPKGRNRTQWAKNCWECGLKFTTSTQSNAHMREKHQDRLFKCLECPSTFINERSLVLHNRSHNKVPRTVTEKTCSKCGVMFPTKSEKYKHMMEDHADSMYKCSQCPKLFVYKAKLEKHEKTPHDTMEEKPPQKLVAETACSICGLQLETRPKKRHHMLTAHSEPKFECSLCGKQFYYKQLLDRHETSHRKQNKRLTDASKSDGNNINNHIVDGSYGNTAAGLQLECKADEFSIHENRADIAVDNEAYGFKPDEEKPNDNNTIQIKTEPNDTTYIIVPTQPQLIKQENSYG